MASAAGHHDTDRGRAARLAGPARAIGRHRRLVTALQVAALVVVLAFAGSAMAGSWDDAVPRLRSADPFDLAAALALLAAYYVVFVLGWVAILRGLGIGLTYPAALRAEMLSMLAKYVPGGVWTPAARVVAVRRAGVDDTGRVLASIALEAGLSAVAGVAVFVGSLAFVDDVDAPLVPLVAFGLLLVVLLHPRVFVPAGSFLLRPLGTGRLPALTYRRTLALVAFYAANWVMGGVALFFLLRAIGDPDPTTISYLGGVGAVGAIVAVLVVFAPSGLGVREGAMYALLLAVVPAGVALGGVVLNRLAITLVEALIFLVVSTAGRGPSPLLREPEAAEERAPA
jgi:uncharacterized membrane protein YbhN (UPF0104 family)